MSLELVILTGLPGAGKSTFFRARFANTHVHVSKDNWPNARRRQQRQLRAIEEALARGASVVVDNTNPTVIDRAALIALGKRYRARVRGYFFDPPLDACLTRNRARAVAQKVPDSAILAIRRRLEPPTQAEGFDELTVVRD